MVLLIRGVLNDDEKVVLICRGKHKITNVSINADISPALNQSC